MEYYTYHFRFEELNIKSATISRFMGYDNYPPPEPFPELIEEVLKLAPGYCDLTGGYTIRENIHIDKSDKSLHVDGISFSVQRIIASQLRKSEHIALFICTAGPAIGEWSRQLMQEGDMLKGYVVDVVGSEAVDAAMDIIQDRLETDIKSRGMHITDRYSPGYCDWQVSEQNKLFSFFPENYCGIKLSPSSLMYPIKSVSGIIGIGKEARQTGYVCNLCDMTNCIYRNKRVQTPFE
jgi:hypothetical protein